MVHQLVQQIAQLDQLNQLEKKKLDEIIRKQKDIQDELQREMEITSKKQKQLLNLEEEIHTKEVQISSCRAAISKERDYLSTLQDNNKRIESDVTTAKLGYTETREDFIYQLANLNDLMYQTCRRKLNKEVPSDQLAKELEEWRQNVEAARLYCLKAEEYNNLLSQVEQLEQEIQNQNTDMTCKECNQPLGLFSNLENEQQN